MSEVLLICSIIMLSCVFVNVVSRKYGMPSLLLFMGLGMLFGSDGLFKIHFDNYHILQQLSTIALVFIIFYGGFSTKWSTAKPVVKQATLLSTFGVIITALCPIHVNERWGCNEIRLEESLLAPGVLHD